MASGEFSEFDFNIKRLRGPLSYSSRTLKAPDLTKLGYFEKEDTLDLGSLHGELFYT